MVSENTPRRSPATAAELLAELSADPEIRARQAAHRKELARQAAVWRAAEQPLIDELRAAGLGVDTVWMRFPDSFQWEIAIPILLEHLRRPYPDRVRDGIARGLGRREARPVWDELVALYVEENAGTETKDGLAATLGAIADRSRLDQVLGLMRDERHGGSRILLISALTRLRSRALLEEFVEDPVLGKEARHRLSGGTSST